MQQVEVENKLIKYHQLYSFFIVLESDSDNKYCRPVLPLIAGVSTVVITSSSVT